MSVVLITGSSRGIGLTTAVHLAEKGHTVYASMRDLDKGGEVKSAAAEKGVDVTLCRADVNDEASVRKCIDEVLAREGRIDVLVNNAGVGPFGPVEEMDDAACKAVFETNFFGAMRAARAVLPAMRTQKSGVIVNVSSVSGRVAAGCMGIYAASKFALEAASESLAQELVPYGVRVAIIEPSFTTTPMLEAAADRSSDSSSTAYPHAVTRTHALLQHARQIGDPPQRVAETIESAILDTEPKLRYPVGEGAQNFIAGRSRMTDEDWVAMGRHSTVEDYFQEFAMRFGG